MFVGRQAAAAVLEVVVVVRPVRQIDGETRGDRRDVTMNHSLSLLALLSRPLLLETQTDGRGPRSAAAGHSVFCSLAEKHLRQP